MVEKHGAGEAGSPLSCRASPQSDGKSNEVMELKARIMIVDDEESIRFIVRRMLRASGYEVVEASSGEEALEKLKTENVDLVLMDVMMPGMDGWEATRRIKSDERTKRIPVAMLTVRGEDEDKTSSFREAMADAHINKPIIREKMMGTVEWILENVPKRREQ